MRLNPLKPPALPRELAAPSGSSSPGLSLPTNGAVVHIQWHQVTTTAHASGIGGIEGQPVGLANQAPVNGKAREVTGIPYGLAVMVVLLSGHPMPLLIRRVWGHSMATTRAVGVISQQRERNLAGRSYHV
jgi:hypothetical protein